LQVFTVVQAGASSQNKLMNRPEQDNFFSLPRALFQSPYGHSSPDHALAFAMAMHPRLGKCCSFHGLDSNLLHIILGHSINPASMINFINKDLQMFPGLLTSMAVDVSLSLDKAAACVDRLHSFLTFVANLLEQDPHCSGFAGSMDYSAMLGSSSKPFLPPQPFEKILSLMPGKRLQCGVADNYLWLMSEVLRTEFVHRDYRGGQIITFDPSRQDMPWKFSAPRPTSKLISSVVSEMLCTSLRDRAGGDDISFPKLAKELHSTLESCEYRSVWLVRGVYAISSRPYGDACLSIKMNKQLGQVFSRVKDSTQQTPHLSNCMISGIEASKMFQSFCQEKHESFMQRFEVAAHQRQFPQTPEICHTLLNLAEQLEERVFSSDVGVREVSAAALQVHFFCIMVKQLLEACGSTLDLVDMHSQWMRVNSIPHVVADAVDAAAAANVDAVSGNPKDTVAAADADDDDDAAAAATVDAVSGTGGGSVAADTAAFSADVGGGGTPGPGTTELHQQLEVSGIKDRSAIIIDQAYLQVRNSRLFDKASGKVAGSAGWGHGISGSIGPAGMRKIFECLELKGRSLMDWGGGNGRVIFAAGIWGASVAYAVELPDNTGNFYIYDAARKLLENQEWKEIKEQILFDLQDKLLHQDIDEVAYLISFICIFCT
jgi:hypothetical protein